MLKDKSDKPISSTPLVIDKVAEDIEALKESKALSLYAAGKTATYIRDRVYKYSPNWFKKYNEFLNSDDPQMQRTAFIEFNKLQGRVLPTQLQGSDGQQVQINIIGMGIDMPTQDNNREAVEGECS